MDKIRTCLPFTHPHLTGEVNSIYAQGKRAGAREALMEVCGFMETQAHLEAHAGTCTYARALLKVFQGFLARYAEPEQKEET